MAVVYGQILPEVGDVATYSARLRNQKLQEAEQVRQDRIAFGKALERKQQERVAPITNKATKANKSERERERELFSKVEQTKEWKEFHAAAEARRNRKRA